MKKHRVILLALMTMSAFGTIVVTSAYAEVTLLAEWLINGVGVTALTSVEGIGEILLKDSSNGSDVTCSAIGVGSVGPNGEGEITEILTLAGVAVSLVSPVLCKRGAVCEESTTDIEVSPENLPWRGSLFLMEDGKFLTSVLGQTAYSVSCLVLGIKITDECSTTGAAFLVENVAGGVTSVGPGEPLANCSIGGAETGELEALAGNLLTALTGTLSISSE
jgi:hypothetical protein